MEQKYIYMPECGETPHVSALMWDGQIMDIVCFSVWAQALESVINGNEFIDSLN